MSATPSNRMATHPSLIAAVDGARRDGGEAALLYLHVGPVASFVTAARRTQDLFVGSFSIAYLTFLGAKAIAEAAGQDAVLCPALAELPLAQATLFNREVSRVETDEREVLTRSSLLRSSLSNKVLAIVPTERAEEIARAATVAVRDGWKGMAKAVHEGLDRRDGLDGPAKKAAQRANPKTGDGAWDAGWDAQIDDHLEIDVVVQPWSERSADVRALLERTGTLVDGEWLSNEDEGSAGEGSTNAIFRALFDLTHRVMLAHRTALPMNPRKGDHRPKCSQCGMREQMGPFADQPAAQQRMTRRFFEALGDEHQKSGGTPSGSPGGRQSLQLGRSDGLCAVCLTKRFAPEFYFGAKRAPFGIDWRENGDRFLLRFPSVSTVASAPFRRRAMDSKRTVAEGGDTVPDALLRELAKDIQALRLDFTPPGNLMPGLDKLGRDDAALSLEGEWLYDFAYEPLTAWRSHRAIPWDDNNEDCRELKTKLPKPRDRLAKICGGIDPRRTVRPSTYYAVLVLDADDLGEWLTGRHPAAPAIGELSARLSRLALALYEVVERRFLGRIVYSGGDDLLALLPLQTALPCLRAVRETIRSEEHLGRDMTVSAGLGIAHVRTPLQTALRLARDAEQDAKRVRNSATHKNSFAVKVDKRSGGALELVLPFEAKEHKDDPAPVDVLQAIEDLLRWSDANAGEGDAHPLRSVNVAYRIAEEASTLAALPIEAFRRRLSKLLPERGLRGQAAKLLHESKLPRPQDLPPEVSPEQKRSELEGGIDPGTVGHIANILLLVRFLLREEHGIVTADLLRDLEKREKEEAS